MKNSSRKNTGIAVSAAAGAILMALVIIMVFGLKTGIAGAVLTVLIVAVSVLFGWMVGMSQRIQRRNRYSYMRGYRKGLAKHTTVIEYPLCRFTFASDGTAADNMPDFR